MNTENSVEMVGDESGRSRLQIFAQKLRDLRRRSGLTQETFAEAANCSSNHVAKMERGLRLPSTHLLQSLTQALAEAGIEQESLEQLEGSLLACKQGDNSSDEETFDEAETAPSNPLKNNLASRLGTLSLTRTLFGREQTLEQVLQLYREGNGQVVAITGLGGVGKTAFTMELAHRAEQEGLFERIIFESAKTEVLQNGVLNENLFMSLWYSFSPSFTFEGLLDTLAFQFDRDDLLGDGVQIPEKLDGVSEEMARKPTLIIVDNLEASNNPKLIFTYLSRMLAQTGASMIITAREAPPYMDGYTLQLGMLDREAALEFLRYAGYQRNIPAFVEPDPDLDAALEQVVDHTGGHPLTLELVLYQLNTFSLPRILEDLRTGYNEKAILRRTTNHADSAGGLYTYVFKDIWQSLSKASQRALLRLKEAPEKLSDEVITALLNKKNEPRQKEEEMANFDFVLVELVHASLLETKGGLIKTYVMHPLIRQFLQTGLAEYWQLDGVRM